jgi:nucleotide-binding universal stress UspA family protein
MGAFGHHWLCDMIVGSFTSKMLTLSQKPLLLVR